MDYYAIIINWTHIKDNLHPTKTRGIREVIDIYTNRNYFDWDYEHKIFDKLKFTDIHIHARNMNNTELGFTPLEAEKVLRISLGKLDDLPNVLSSFYKEKSNKKYPNVKHLKLEIDYVQPENEELTLFEIENKNLSSWKNFHIFPQYRTVFGFRDKLMPEFHLKVPKGMEIIDNSVELVVCPDKNGNFPLKYYPPEVTVTKPRTRKKHDIYLEEKQMKIFNKKIDEYIKKEYNFGIFVAYKAKHGLRFKFISFFAFSTLIISVLITASSIISLIFKLPIIKSTELTIGLGLFTMLIPLLVMYMDILVNNYEIPYNKYVLYSIIGSFMLLILQIMTNLASLYIL
ncbi:MAG: hypothetical protein LBU74_08165 [Methanobacteriaceae archaeon]|jgi:hypothetical protein|nr:hypothetical protein [Candidatus Methanorudis spinitermitis]